jgi:hypothetical protein
MLLQRDVPTIRPPRRKSKVIPRDTACLPTLLKDHVPTTSSPLMSDDSGAGMVVQAPRPKTRAVASGVENGGMTVVTRLCALGGRFRNGSGADVQRGAKVRLPAVGECPLLALKSRCGRRTGLHREATSEEVGHAPV